MANGKKKGSKNERTLSKWFSDWSGYEFTRVPASGGLRWKKTDNITGDIICADPRHSRRFPFSIETKSYKDINFEHIIIGVKNIKVMEFWQQAKDDAERASMKVPLLFMRYNGMPASTWFVVMTFELYLLAVKKGCSHEYSMFVIHPPEVTIFPKLIPEESEILVVLNSKDLYRVDYRKFATKVKQRLRNGKKV